MFEGDWADAACVVSTPEGFQPGFFFEDGATPFGWNPAPIILNKETTRQMIDETVQSGQPQAMPILLDGLAATLLMLTRACRNAKCPKVRYLVDVDGEWAKARYVDGELMAVPV